MQQSGPEWLAWRNAGLGSSDIGVLMGFNQWKTEDELFREKTGQKKSNFKSNAAMERGQKLEPCVRAEWELTQDKEFPPATFIHKDHNFLKASLDGWHEETRTVIEIKCPNAKAHASAKFGNVPDYYLPQVNHLMLVTNALHLDYLSFDGWKIAHVPVKPDLEYQGRIIEKAIAFWSRVQDYLTTKE